MWGKPDDPGIWLVLSPRLSDEKLSQEKTRLALAEQAWLHSYVMAEILTQTEDRRVYELAAWMRRFSNVLGRPDVLVALPDSAYRRLWRASFPSDTEIKSAGEVMKHLYEISQWYDEHSLLKEIRAWPGTRVQLSYEKMVYREKIPKLEVSRAFSQEDIDWCLRIFILFLVWPRPKNFSAACFTNTNPLEGPNDLKSIRLFYRRDRKKLVFAIERASKNFYPEWDVCISIDELRNIRSMDELYDDEVKNLIIEDVDG
jgi:hypothetical protein